MTDSAFNYDTSSAIGAGFSGFLQHHGTTLVEYFYRRASEEQTEAQCNFSVNVDQYSFRVTIWRF